MKKVLLLIGFVFVFFSLALPIFAQEEPEKLTLGRNETVNKDYFAARDEVDVLGTINGDAYVAGGKVTVDGIINGDLLVAGGDITITGDVRGDIRTAGGDITISEANVGGNITILGGQITVDSSAVIAGSIVSAGGNIQILAPIGRGITVLGGSVLIGNSVGGEVIAGVGELTLSPNASVNGNVTYWSDTEAAISDQASVSGNIKREMPPRDEDKEKAAKGIAAAFAGIALIIKLMDIVSTLVIGILLLLVAPFYLQKTSDLIRDKVGTTLLVGLVALIITPIIGVILLITVLGIPLGILLFILYFITLWLAKIFAIYAFGGFIFAKTNNKAPSIVVFIVGLIIFEILAFIPIIGGITELLALLTGLGALVVMKKDYYANLHSKKLI